MVLDGDIKELLEEADKNFDVEYSMSMQVIQDLIDYNRENLALTNNSYKLGYLQGKRSQTKK